MKRKFREESGSVTVEATISLSAFMFAIVTLLTIVNICIVQAKISMAINATAKELSHYSYLYSLTGIPASKEKLNAAAQENKDGINGVLSDINTVFTEIQNIGNSDRYEPDDISAMLQDFEQSGKNIKEAGGALAEKLEELAKDPKGVAMGLAKIAATDGWDLASSRLIAAPLSKGLCKKNLVAEKDGDVDAYLKHLGVVPDAKGSYIGGLDFSHSSLFPDGSNEIRVTVSYDVKVIALLPIDFSFHFTQTAVTHGWLAGEKSYKSVSQILANDNIWTKGTVQERSDLIRHQGIQEYLASGYEKTSDVSGAHVYSSENNEFIVIHSMNPLYSGDGDRALTLDDISEAAIKDQLEHLCVDLDDSTKNLKTVETKKTSSDGSTTKNSYECEDSKRKIVLVIPQDEGLDDKIQSIIDTCNTRGVTIELVSAYGNGAKTTTVTNNEGSEE